MTGRTGDSATLRDYAGSVSGADTIALEDGVTFLEHVSTGAGDDLLSMGSNNTFVKDVTLGLGDDTILGGDGNVFDGATTTGDGNPDNDDHLFTRLRGGRVTYLHMLFDRHQIVTAEGAPSESFHPGAASPDGLGAAPRAEFLDLFPALRADAGAYGQAARRSLRRHEARLAASEMRLA